MHADPGAAEEQLLRGAGHVGGTVLVRDAVVAALLAQMFAQQLTGTGIKHSHRAAIPLHLDGAADPARRRTVVSGFHFDAAIEVHSSVAELIVPEGFDGERK